MLRISTTKILSIILKICNDIENKYTNSGDKILDIGSNDGVNKVIQKIIYVFGWKI